MPAVTQPPPLQAVFDALFRRWGPQHWWPAKSRFEMIVGAILTQNTAWTGVEKAIANLRAASALTPAGCHALPEAELGRLIRPAGTFRIKARRLRAFTTMLFAGFSGSLDRLFRLDIASLREVLLNVHGIGPETADCILLYAAQRPVFVIDAYTRRLLARHGWSAPKPSYDELAAQFTDALPPDVGLFNEYHALIVELGKRHCRAKPVCAGCPLAHWLPHADGTAGQTPAQTRVTRSRNVRSCQGPAKRRH